MSFELTTLGEYARIQGGYAYKSKDFTETGTCPVLKIKNVRFGTVDYSEASFISPDIANETTEWKTKEGDILISMTGSGPNAPQSLVGRVARVWGYEPEAWINQRVGRVVIKEEGSIHPDFLFYLLSSARSQDYLVSNSSGSANQANISGKTIESLPCPKVDFDESAEIAKILRELDQKIIVNRQINQTLEQIAQAIFKSWFVDFEPTRAKIAAKQAGQDPERAAMAAISGKTLDEIDQLVAEHDVQGNTNVAGAGSAGATLEQLKTTAALFPDTLVDSELGEIPQGWNVNTLSGMVELIGGGTPKKSEDGYWNGEIPWFSIKDSPMDGDVFVLDTELKISGLGLEKSSTKILPVGTTIISARGTVGKLAFVGVPMAMNQSCYGVKGREGIEPIFNYFNLKEAVSTLRKNTHGAVFDTITRDTFNSVAAVLPNTLLIGKFEETVTALFERIKSNLLENSSLEQLRDALLPKLLAGNIVEKLGLDIGTSHVNSEDNYHLDRLVLEIEKSLPTKEHFIVKNEDDPLDEMMFLKYIPKVNGLHGEDGVEYFQLPDFLKCLHDRAFVRKPLEATIDTASGIPFLAEAITKILSKFLGKHVTLNQRAALVLLCFPKKLKRTTSELLERSQEVCKAAKQPLFDEEKLYDQLKVLVSFNLIKPAENHEQPWELVSEFKHEVNHWK